MKRGRKEETRSKNYGGWNREERRERRKTNLICKKSASPPRSKNSFHLFIGSPANLIASWMGKEGEEEIIKFVPERRIQIFRGRRREMGSWGRGSVPGLKSSSGGGMDSLFLRSRPGSQQAAKMGFFCCQRAEGGGLP